MERIFTLKDLKWKYRFRFYYQSLINLFWRLLNWNEPICTIEIEYSGYDVFQDPNIAFCTFYAFRSNKAAKEAIKESLAILKESGSDILVTWYLEEFQENPIKYKKYLNKELMNKDLEKARYDREGHAVVDKIEIEGILVGMTVSSITAKSKMTDYELLTKYIDRGEIKWTMK